MSQVLIQENLDLHKNDVKKSNFYYPVKYAQCTIKGQLHQVSSIS